MENHHTLAVLFQKYIDNSCSPEEMDQLMELLKDDAYKAYAQELIAQQSAQKTTLRRDDFALKNRLEQRLQNILETEKTTIKLRPEYLLKRVWWAAAAVFILITVGGYLWLNTSGAQQKVMAKTSVQNNAETITCYTRNIMLPDGSTVILKEGSTLNYPGNFSGKTREVALVGEAYFDIVHDQQHPFVIQTGKIKTTVLGTAFNIKAYPGQKDITVSVTRGKVKVENQSKVLAVLSKDEQVVYSLNNELYEQQKVDAVTIVTDWTKQDMVFDDNTFLDIAGILQKRFGVQVIFANPLLEQCTITASFDGTEPLEKVLDVLCRVRTAAYTIKDDNTIVIDGQGCK